AADLLFEPAFADRLFTVTKRYLAACFEFALFIDLYFGRENMVARRDGLCGRHEIALLVVIVVFPMKLAVLHKDGKSPADTAAADKHAFGTALRYLHLRRDRVVKILGIRRRSFWYADRSRRVY